MQYQRWSHIATKGFTALFKGLSLVTRGIQDNLLPGKPIPRIEGYAFLAEYRIKGIKEFDTEKVYNIIGKIAYCTCEILALQGIKSFKLAESYALVSRIAYELLFETYLKGRKAINVDALLNISGRKQFSLTDILEIAGIKQYDMKLECELEAIKSFQSTIDKPLIGIRQINLNKNLEIAGKKDITNILTALDLI